jgi:hypothetical protein
MSVLYPQRNTATVSWRDFTGQPRYLWTADVGWDDETTGLLWDWPNDDPGLINNGVTLAQAERTLRQLGHTIGDWDG